jgi:hypothetical protein
MAWRLTSMEPGTTMTRTFGFTLRPLRMAAAARRSEMRELVQLPMKTTLIGMTQEQLAGFEIHVAQGLGNGIALARIAIEEGSGMAGDRNAHAGIGAPGDHGLERIGVDGYLAIEGCAFVGGELTSSGRRRRPNPRLSGRRGGRGGS